jgi:hypothetical protein
MAAQRSSASKRQRDIDKRSRAAEKRDRRQRKSDPSADDPSATDAAAAAAESGAAPADSGAILEQMEQLQRDFDADIIDFETYDERKAELLSHIQI